MNHDGNDYEFYDMSWQKRKSIQHKKRKLVDVCGDN